MASLAWTSAEGAGPALSERGEDLGAISDSLARAGRGEGSVLLFEGSPGIGKTLGIPGRAGLAELLEDEAGTGGDEESAAAAG